MTPFGGVSVSIACTLFGCGFIPSFVRMYPKYFVSSSQNFNFGALNFKPTSHNLVRTTFKCYRWSSRLALVIQSRSSRYVFSNSRAAIRSDIFA